jgi:hypothetical protein
MEDQMKLLHSIEFAAGLIGVAATVAAIPTPATAASARLATPLLPTDNIRRLVSLERMAAA